MCVTCGCSDHENVTLTSLPVNALGNVGLQFKAMDAPAAPPAEAISTKRDAETIKLETEILAKNDGLAEQNRTWLRSQNILALNLVSSPGSGKTTLLERSIRDLQASHKLSVIEGDQQTLLDAERIQATGCPVVQLNTGAGCHLEADMLAEGLKQLRPEPDSIVMIENVGNLVCPALFDLGEYAKVAILSVTEGEDKPLKYPHMFRASELMIINKVDLLPHVNFDVDRCIDYARQVNPDIQILQLSATTGEGLSAWYDWLAAAADTQIVGDATRREVI